MLVMCCKIIRNGVNTIKGVIDVLELEQIKLEVENCKHNLDEMGTSL